MSRILRLKPASQPQNLRAEPEKLERSTYRSTIDMCMGWDFQWEWESNGNPMGMGIKHRIGNKNGREWETSGNGNCLHSHEHLFPKVLCCDELIKLLVL